MERQQQFRKLFSYYPDQGALRRELYPKHLQFFAAGAPHAPLASCPPDCDGSPHRDRLALAGNRTGKALRNGTPVATPSGWRPIESLSVGDSVVSGDGSLTRVSGVFPQGERPMLRFTFDAGESIDCCPEHLWVFQRPAERFASKRARRGTAPAAWAIGNAMQILGETGFDPPAPRRVAMPASRPWALPRRPVDLDPYLIGVLIGDGGLTQYVRLSSKDQEIVDEVARVLPPGVALTKMPGDGCDYMISLPGGLGHGTARRPGANLVLAALQRNGLYGKKADQKRVPQDYLLNDVPTRLATLQGLMDTDGSIGPTMGAEFSSASRGLADDVVWLVQSLGGKCSVEQRQTYYTHKGERRAGLPSYRVRIRMSVCPFRLTRKAARWSLGFYSRNRVLHRIEQVELGAATCISVEHPSHTYVTAHGIVTHNTEGMGGYETALHLTGLYPHWWPGLKFDRPIDAWASGRRNEGTRDIVQAKLFGSVLWRGREKGLSGTGLIPRDNIGHVTWKRGIADFVDTVQIKHKAGGWSQIGLKSYEQGQSAFQGTEKDLIWLDEEPPMLVYVECGVRLMTRAGHLLMTFTPELGMTEVVQEFWNGNVMRGASTV